MPKAGFPKICNYCKNHPETGQDPVLEKHHRPCLKYNNKEHFEVCKPCKKNYQKTENVRKWRANKITKISVKEKKIIDNIVQEIMKDEEIFNLVNRENIDQNKESNEGIVEMTVDDFIVEDTTYIESEEISSTEQSNQERKDSGFTLFVQHPLFPKGLLTEDDGVRFQSQIENLIDDFRDTEKTPKFISQVVENGSWRVTCVDEFTQNWFKEKASELTCLVDNTNVPVRIIPSNEYPSLICGCFIPGNVIDSAKILSRFQKQNSGLDTSRWYINEIEQQEKQFFVSFGLDSVSLSKIREKNCMLNIGMNQIHFFMCEESEQVS